MKAVDSEEAANRLRRRKIIISVIVVSVGVHFLGGIGAAFWIMARYFDKPKASFEVKQPVKIDPEEREHRMEVAQLESLRPKPVMNNRIQSLRPTEFALPELPDLPTDQAMPIDTHALIADNMDTLSMARTGQGSGPGGGFFGGSGKAGSGFLEGTYYDFKFFENGKPSGLGEGGLIELLGRFANSWDASILAPYYRAPRKLYATRIVMPVMEAEDAPKAFKVNKPGSYWAVHYKGKVEAPEAGTYRFVGLADDFLLVRFGGRLVLDASIGEVAPAGRDGDLRLFAPFFKEGKHDEVYRNIIRGHRAGKTFEVRKGGVYDIEIVVGENPGGEFYAFLFMERVGANYAKDPQGQPIVPFFEMIEGESAKRMDGKVPPAAGTTEFWKPVPSTESLERSRFSP